MHYYEKENEIELYMERNFSGGILYIQIWRSGLTKWKNGGSISSKKQEEIIENIRSALKFMEIELELEDS